MQSPASTATYATRNRSQARNVSRTAAHPGAASSKSAAIGGIGGPSAGTRAGGGPGTYHTGRPPSPPNRCPPCPPPPRVGIDLGTTYSSIAALDRHGRPESVANAAGEFATPSAVLFEPDGEPVVGGEAARSAVAHPDRVVTHAKRFLHDAGKKWFVGGRAVTPVDVSALILRDLLDAARTKHGDVTEAVVTVPVQFGAAERRRTVEAAERAGLTDVTLIDEPVAAALCHVLAGPDAAEGGLWFSELADATTVLVFDLGGGTLDLALVRYGPEGVVVRAAGGGPAAGRGGLHHRPGRRPRRPVRPHPPEAAGPRPAGRPRGESSLTERGRGGEAGPVGPARHPPSRCTTPGRRRRTRSTGTSSTG